MLAWDWKPKKPRKARWQQNKGLDSGARQASSQDLPLLPVGTPAAAVSLC